MHEHEEQEKRKPISALVLRESKKEQKMGKAQEVVYVRMKDR